MVVLLFIILSVIFIEIEFKPRLDFTNGWILLWYGVNKRKVKYLFNVK